MMLTLFISRKPMSPAQVVNQNIGHILMWWCEMESKGIAKVVTIHPEGNMNVCTTFYCNPSNNWRKKAHLIHATQFIKENVLVLLGSSLGQKYLNLNHKMWTSWRSSKSEEITEVLRNDPGWYLCIFGDTCFHFKWWMTCFRKSYIQMVLRCTSSAHEIIAKKHVFNKAKQSF